VVRGQRTADSSPVHRCYSPGNRATVITLRCRDETCARPSPRGPFRTLPTPPISSHISHIHLDIGASTDRDGVAGDAQFESRPRSSSVPPAKFRDSMSIRPEPFPSRFFPIHHSPVIVPFGQLATDGVLKQTTTHSLLKYWMGWYGLGSSGSG
jgi:hypothetical protein